MKPTSPIPRSSRPAHSTRHRPRYHSVRSTLLELVDRGLDPEATIADGGTGLRAGHHEALPQVPCRGDVWHALHEVLPLARFVDNRAYEALAVVDKLQRQLARPGKRRDQMKRKWTVRLRLTCVAAGRAVDLASDVALLLDWLREDIRAVSGPDEASRRTLYDFVVAELRAREGLCPHKIEPVRKYLENQRDDLLAFALQLESDLTTLAATYQVSVATAYEILEVTALSRGRLPSARSSRTLSVDVDSDLFSG